MYQTPCNAPMPACLPGMSLPETVLVDLPAVSSVPTGYLPTLFHALSPRPASSSWPNTRPTSARSAPKHTCKSNGWLNGFIASRSILGDGGAIRGVMIEARRAGVYPAHLLEREFPSDGMVASCGSGRPGPEMGRGPTCFSQVSVRGGVGGRAAHPRSSPHQ